jgi:hypothetical protein
MTLEEARQFALSLPETSEEPHFDKQSYRVNRKIFATVPPDGDHLHIFVEEADVHAAVAENPAAFEELCWGKKMAGVRVTLSKTDAPLVLELLEDSWRMRAPKKLAEEFTRNP